MPFRALRGGNEDTTDLIAHGIKANTPLLIDVNLDGSFKPMWRAAENSRRRPSETDIPHRPAAAQTSRQLGGNRQSEPPGLGSQAVLIEPL
jgi:hypothetical protein